MSWNKPRIMKRSLKKQLDDLKDELATTNEFKDKFKASLAKLDELIKGQRTDGDKRGLGYEEGESSIFGQRRSDQRNFG